MLVAARADSARENRSISFIVLTAGAPLPEERFLPPRGTHIRLGYSNPKNAED